MNEEERVAYILKIVDSKLEDIQRRLLRLEHKVFNIRAVPSEVKK